MQYRVVWLSSLTLSLWLGACDSNQVRIAFDTKNMTSQNYQLESQMKLILQDSVDTPAALGSRLRVLFHTTPVVSYDDGSARYQVGADSVSYHSDQRSVEECLHVERTLALQEFQYKMGTNGAIQDMRLGQFVPDLENTDLDLRRLLLKVQPELPGSAVKAGDTWERQHALDEGNGKQAIVYKWFQVEDVFDHDHKRMAKLRMNLKYRIETGVDASIQSRDFVLGSGEVLFNITDGRIEDANLEISGVLDVLLSQTTSDSTSMRVRQVIRLRRLS